MIEESTLTFTDYGIDNYRLFLKAKQIPEFRMLHDANGISCGMRFPARFAHMVGLKAESVEQDQLPMPDFLFDDQRAIVSMALDAKRFADWKDCGLGKTLEELEWSRQVAHITGKRVLIVTFNEIVGEFINTAAQFYGPAYELTRLDSKQAMRDWCKLPGSGIAITNYEKFNPEKDADGHVEQIIVEIGLLGGIALDESSRLKAGGGKQKWAIIKSTRGIPYKLSATGTPAPNDVMEFASQASFLERIRDEHDVIWTYFTRDPKTQEWTVKKHARPHFFRWMASWSIYVADPRRYGWRLSAPDVPQPEFVYEEVPATVEQIDLQHAASSNASGDGQGELYGDKRLGMVSQLQLLEAAKGFIYTPTGFDRVKSDKPARVATIALEQFWAKRQTLIWCEYDAEVELIVEALAARGLHAVALGGNTKKKDRQAIIQGFKDGTIPLLVSKARMLGYGQNFQNCTAMIFSGFSDSFESFYQAVRRSYRYGQSRTLKVYIPYVKSLEGPVLENLLTKVTRFSELIKEQEAAYLAARKELAA